jgi:pyruvate dehydrogenase E1 component beta subunit
LAHRQPRRQIAAIIASGVLGSDAPVGRVCSAEVPIPYAKHLELAALPSVEAIVAAVKAVMHA